MDRAALLAAIKPEVDAFAARLVDTFLAQVAKDAQAAPKPPTPAPAPAQPQTPCIDATGLAAFFDAVRSVPPLGPGLSAQEVGGSQHILMACSAARWPLSWAAYALATAYHETAGTMTPIKEYGRGQGRPYGVAGKHAGQIAFGRGYVQLTWDYNYELMDKALGLGGALTKNYDLALDPDVAARIMLQGMESGLFNGAGKGLGAYLPAVADIHQFSNARRTVNVLDKAVLIAGYALTFQDGLKPVWKC